jgi:large subunit ribosomal protein L14
MLQLRTRIVVADNTGARELEFIGMPGKGNKKIAGIGDLIKCVVKKATPNGMVKDHEKVMAIVVRTRKATRRIDGSVIRFDDNAAVVIESVKDKTPKGTRIFGPVAREIKDLGYTKIASMAPEVY